MMIPWKESLLFQGPSFSVEPSWFSVEPWKIHLILMVIYQERWYFPSNFLNYLLDIGSLDIRIYLHVVFFPGAA